MYHSTVVHGGSFVTFFCNQNWPLLFSKNANNHAFDKKMMIGNSSNRGRQQCFFCFDRLIDIYTTLTIFIGVVLFCFVLFVFSFVSTITTTKSPETV
jgi:hypothetical protein